MFVTIFSDYKTENLRWLNSKQAIEDIATFVKEMNKIYNLEEPKWIVFGGSYAGKIILTLYYV